MYCLLRLPERSTTDLRAYSRPFLGLEDLRMSFMQDISMQNTRFVPPQPCRSAKVSKMACKKAETQEQTNVKGPVQGTSRHLIRPINVIPMFHKRDSRRIQKKKSLEINLVASMHKKPFLHSRINFFILPHHRKATFF